MHGFLCCYSLRVNEFQTVVNKLDIELERLPLRILC